MKAAQPPIYTSSQVVVPLTGKLLITHSDRRADFDNIVK